jgi:DNA repair exonuclease SbcCD nuclease subunit
MAPYRILHCADLHLDRAFVERDLAPSASARRAALRDAFARIVERARTCDALVVAGDLYEHEHVTGDTANMLAHAFEDLECRVLLLPGNHDPHLPGSVYERTQWSSNVHVFSRSEPEAVELTDAIVIWGIAYTGRELDPAGVRAFRAPGDRRRHLLVLHAAVSPAFASGDIGHCPLTPEELVLTGADAVLLGHFHRGASDGIACYPGSPEPLTAGERGVHAVQILELDESGIHRALEPIARMSFEELELDVSGASSAAELEARLRAEIAPRRDPGRTLTATIVGEIDPVCEVRTAELARRLGEGFAALAIRDETQPAIDLEALAEQPTVEGRFAQRMLASAAGEPARSDLYLDAARAGLRALAGQREPVDVG